MVLKMNWFTISWERISRYIASNIFLFASTSVCVRMMFRRSCCHGLKHFQMPANKRLSVICLWTRIGRECSTGIFVIAYICMLARAQRWVSAATWRRGCVSGLATKALMFVFYVFLSFRAIHSNMTNLLPFTFDHCHIYLYIHLVLIPLLDYVHNLS